MDKRLKTILEKHTKWINNNAVYAYLCDAYLCDADLRDADLRGANLRGAYLQNANLQNANLQNANLRGAYLQNANLQNTNLQNANLWGANLRDADLRDANLRGADLRGADLQCADLQGADLWLADLQCADLQGTDLRYTNLLNANLRNAKINNSLLNKLYPIACPEEGSFIGWKACENDTIVKLQILEDAERSSAFTRKCRCSAAKVLAIENIDRTPYKYDWVSSNYDPEFIYKVGEIVSVKNFFDPDRKNECAPGIHFFLTRQEAVDWLN